MIQSATLWSATTIWVVKTGILGFQWPDQATPHWLGYLVMAAAVILVVGPVVAVPLALSLNWHRSSCARDRIAKNIATWRVSCHNARMATAIIMTGAEEHQVISGADGERPTSSANMPHFRFGLRQLLLFVAAVCALLTVAASTSTIFGLLIWLATAVVAMHVFATALGHSLRAKSDAAQVRKLTNAPGESPHESAAVRSATIAAIRSAPRSPWHGHRSIYLPWLSRLIIGAMLFGGFAGALLLSGIIGNRASPEGIAVGAVSFSILGGWLSFLAGNFYGVFRHGFRDALAADQQNNASRRSRHQ